MSNEACHTPKDALNEFKALRQIKGQYVWDVIPSYPTVVRPCSLALAVLPVTQVNVERLFSMKPLLSGLLSPAQAGCRRGDAPALREYNLNMI